MTIMDTRLREQLRALSEGQARTPLSQPVTVHSWNNRPQEGGSRSRLLLTAVGLLVVVVAGLSALVYSGGQLPVHLQLASPVTTPPAVQSTVPTAADEKAAMARLSAGLVQRKQIVIPPAAVENSPVAPVQARQVVTLLAVQPVTVASLPPLPSSPDSKTATPPAESEADAMKLAHRASELIQQGQIAGARVLLERAQAARDPKIDFALAETFDPNQLRLWKVLGMVGDPARARSLYQRAAKSGMAEASARIAALPAK